MLVSLKSRPPDHTGVSRDALFEALGLSPVLTGMLSAPDVVKKVPPNPLSYVERKLSKMAALTEHCDVLGGVLNKCCTPACMTCIQLCQACVIKVCLSCDVNGKATELKNYY